MLAALRADVPHLDAVELILPEAMAVVAAHLGATPPVGGGRRRGAYVVVECADHADPTDELTGARSPDRPRSLDAAVDHRGSGPRPVGRVPRPDHRVDQRARRAR